MRTSSLAGPKRSRSGSCTSAFLDKEACCGLTKPYYPVHGAFRRDGLPRARGDWERRSTKIVPHGVFEVVKSQYEIFIGLFHFGVIALAWWCHFDAFSPACGLTAQEPIWSSMLSNNAAECGPRVYLRHRTNPSNPRGSASHGLAVWEDSALRCSIPCRLLEHFPLARQKISFPTLLLLAYGPCEVNLLESVVLVSCAS